MCEPECEQKGAAVEGLIKRGKKRSIRYKFIKGLHKKKI